MASAGHHAALRELGADKLIDYKTTDFRNAQESEKYDLIFVAVNQPVTKQSCKCVLGKDAKFCSVESLTEESSKIIATVYPEVYPSDMPPLLAHLKPSHEYIRPH